MANILEYLDWRGDLTLETGATLVHGLEVPEDKHLSDYLPEGTAFGLRTYDEATGTCTKDKGLFADAYTTNAYNIPNMALVVETHKHTFAAGTTKCECGFTCAQHDWSKKNGVCTVGGSACPHNVGATEAGGVWACDTCGQTVTAKVTAPGGAITYYADGYVDNNVKSGLYFAIKAAKTGSTVAALGGEYSGGYVTGNKTLTLDVSNGKTIDGMLYVGEKEKEKDTGNKLIVRGSAEISYVIVEPDNTLDLTGWTGRIGSLTVKNGGKATLNGGTFATLNVNSATAGSLLASGYAFQNADTSAYVEYSSTANMENVKVVKCPHSDVTLKEEHTGAECKYCGASFAATLDDAPYGTIDAAVTDWLVVEVPPLQLALQSMVPALFIGLLCFMLSTLIRNGNGTAVMIIIIGLLLFASSKILDVSKWNVFLNPFDVPLDKNPQIFYNTLFDNRLIILLSSFIFLLVGLYKTQNREKFI